MRPHVHVGEHISVCYRSSFSILDLLIRDRVFSIGFQK